MLLISPLCRPGGRPRLTALMTATLSLSVGVASSSSAHGSLFENLAGTWSGAGTVTVSEGNSERLRCRAEYSASGSTRLHIALRCASDSLNLEVSSDVARQGDRLGGTWNESSTGVSGDLSGTVGPSQMQASVSGPSVSGHLTLVLRGDVQSLTLTTEGSVSANASAVLSRS